MADSKSSKNTKRRLRAPAPTVREQAKKAQEQAEKPEGKQRRLRKAAASKASKPAGKIARLFDHQPFKAIKVIFAFIGRILVPKFIRNAFGELKLVTWPDRKKTRDLTFAVIMFAIAFGILVTIIDYGLDKLFKALILN